MFADFIEKEEGWEVRMQEREIQRKAVYQIYELGHVIACVGNLRKKSPV
jgi:hypothetical protein